MSTAIAFMVKPGHTLETEALLLAASIRHFVEIPTRLYAFIESRDLPEVTAWHEEMFSKLGIQLRSIDATPHFRGHYPHGNKIVLCAQTFAEQRVVFLDSDMMFLRRTDLSAITGAPLVLGRSLGGKWGSFAEWEKVYALWGASRNEIPTIDLPRVKGIAAYYNAGMVSFRPETGFGAAWLDAAKRIDQSPDIPNKRPWLDQISLPLTPLAGGPKISEPSRAGFNRRPRRGKVRDITLAHYTPAYLHLSGAGRIAGQVLEAQLGLTLRDLEDGQIARRTRRFRSRVGQSCPNVKIYGERATGVRRLSTLVTQGYDAHLLSHETTTPPILGTIRDALGEDKTTAPLPPEDLFVGVSLRQSLGWVHGAPPLDLLEASAYGQDVLFLCLYRDPHRWLKARHAEPCNPLAPFEETPDLSQFIRHPYGSSTRDAVSVPFDAPPLEIYQAKLRAFLALKARRSEKVLLIPFEVLRGRPQEVHDCIGAHLMARDATPSCGEGKPAEGDPKEGVSSMDLAEIDRQIDPELWAELDRQNILATPSRSRLAEVLRLRPRSPTGGERS